MRLSKPALMLMISGRPLTAKPIQLRSLVPLMTSLGKQFDHVLVELGNVRRLPAAHPVPVANTDFIHPVRARISQVILDGVVAGQVMAFHQAR